MARPVIITFLVFTLAGAPSLSVEKPVAGEFAAFGGGVFGIGAPSGATSGARNHGTVGGSAGIAIKRRWVVFFEYSHMRPGSRNEDYRVPLGREFHGVSNSWANDFSLGAHFNLPLRSQRFVPYAAASIGRITWSAHVSGISTYQSLPDLTIRTERTEGNGGISTQSFSFGGGVRWYLNDRWGLRPEIKWVSGLRHTSFGFDAKFAGRDSFVRASVAIFYQTHPQNRTK